MNQIGRPLETRHGAGSERFGAPDLDGGDDPGGTWLERFREGDESAFDQIVVHYRAMVHRFIFRTVQDAERAEDLSQEVFLRVYKARCRYRPSARFRTWLFTIAARLCLNEIRSRRREHRVIVPMPRGRDPGEEIEQSVADPGARPASMVLEEAELEEAVRSAIADLPPAQRAAILLLRFEELSYKEIAESLGISVMATKSLINRGRESLRIRLKRFLRME